MPFDYDLLKLGADSSPEPTIQDLMRDNPSSGSRAGNSYRKPVKGPRSVSQPRQAHRPTPSSSRPVQSHISPERVRTPDDLAQYFASRVSTPDSPYQSYRWMGDWFAEHIGTTVWCGPVPETPVELSVPVLVRAIDVWSSTHREFRGRQIWPMWVDWITNADLLDEGVVGYASKTPRFNYVMAEMLGSHGIELDPEDPDFSERLSEALGSHPDLSVPGLLRERQKRQRWLGRARQVAEVTGRDVDDVLAELLREEDEALARRTARREQQIEEDQIDVEEDPDEDEEDPAYDHRARGATLRAQLENLIDPQH